MFISTKNDIKAYPFQECYNMTASADLEEWSLAHGIVNTNIWMLPQIQAWFGQLRVRKNDNGDYLPLALLEDNFKGNEWALGLWRLCTKMKRSSLVKTQISPQFSEYSALVPLVLAGLKKYQNILYTHWSVEGLEYVVDKGLYDAMMCKPPTLSLSRVLELREMGLMTKSGPNTGQLKKATATWTLTGLKHTEWGELPALAVTMLSQVWVAHPSIRSNYMILDPLDWDLMPPPIIEVGVHKSLPLAITANDLPWDA